MPRKDVLSIWKPLCLKLHRRTCDEISLSGCRTILDKFLSSSFCTKGICPKESARKAWKIFKEDPFDPRLRTHKIQRLSGYYGRTIYAVEIEGDLRSLFYLDGDVAVSLIIGTHEIYKG
jgi:hypothetical protein